MHQCGTFGTEWNSGGRLHIANPIEPSNGQRVEYHNSSVYQVYVTKSIT